MMQDQEHLKPQLVHLLANAELYCLALGNIYSDPNYHNMNHTGVLQVLLRKGVFVSDTAPTETVLIQTNPLKMNEGEFPKIGDLGDLGDGALLAGLVAFYCPEELAWQSITLSKVPSMTDRLRNLMLVHEFCQHSLPYSVFHMTPEDVCYMREEETFVVHRGKGIPTLSSMQQQQQDGGGMTRAMKEAAGKPSNWEDSRRSSYAGQSADGQGGLMGSTLLNIRLKLEEKRRRIESDKRRMEAVMNRQRQKVGKAAFLQAVTKKLVTVIWFPHDRLYQKDCSPLSSSGGLKKSHSIHQTEAPPMDNREETFVVHRGKGIPTLSSMQQQQQDGGGMTRAMKEAAGKPSNWEDSRRSSYAGRRSRRNSLSEDSQLTLENFGGSQENLHFLGRNPDKEPAVHVGRRDSSASRSSLNDNKSTNLHNALQQEHNGDAVHAELRKASAKATANSDELASILGGDSSPGPAKKTTTFATLPAQSTTTWQQQQQQQQHKPPPPPASSTTDSQSETEEKRRRIESDKRRMEAVMNRQRQKVGKAAFLQAVTKVSQCKVNPIHITIISMLHACLYITACISVCFFQDITDVEQKWLSENENERKTPDIDSMDLETCQQSIAQYNSSLQEIQLDLQRLSNQQSEISQPPQQPPPQPSPQPQPFHQPPLQQQQQTVPMASFATLNSYANRGGVPSPQMNNFGGNQQPPQQPQSPHQQMHSLMYNNHTGQNQQWHSLMNQQPNNYHNDFMQQQQMQNQQNNFMNHQQVHSLMNQQPMNSFATLNNHRNYPNSQGGGGFILNQANNYGGAADLPYQPQSHQQQHHQMNQLMHGGDSAGEFYLHDPPPTPQRRTWGQPPPPESHTPWTNRSVLLSNVLQNVIHCIEWVRADEDELNAGLNRIHITSGSRTYRIPSPTRTHTPISRSSFTQQQQQQSTQRPSTVQNSTAPKSPHVPPQTANDKGFYISFDDDTPPKRPKPPLRVKRMSPKKERALTQVLDALTQQSHNIPNNNNNEIVSPTRLKEPMSPPTPRSAAQPMRVPPTTSQLQNDVDDNEDGSQGVGLIIGSELLNPDPGKNVDKEFLNSLKIGSSAANMSVGGGGGGGGPPKMRSRTQPARPRPKTIHIDSGSAPHDTHDGTLTPSRGKKGSSSNLSDFGEDSRGASPGRTLGRRGSYKTSRGSSCDRTACCTGMATRTRVWAGRRLHDELPRPASTLPRRPGPDPCPHTDDATTTAVGEWQRLQRTRLYKQPATKSNKGIILNAVEYCVFPGVVNREAKRRVLEEINRSEAKHFLVLFRDAGCQFRALYSYCPDTEEVAKLYGTGPKLVSDRMFDKFFKYNSGGKCFSQVHTKHLTVTIDAFTIHNSLWQGKKVNLPSKRDMVLVI
ncbi:hypothetical protein LSTR_LSTR012094 [Laodelphax striatellus]|uniref:CKK domain-containing protein n=1 Tax=Laodelphax striatellus TaxID=195883 RepID=A0A482X2B2_LAOST|nr:hypothetical protein LSTR_LSTR012094 [Laodelphax striatellus]